MKISKNRPVLIYCTSIETLDSYIDLQKIRDCNVVGICTDEYVLESSYRDYPIIGEDRIAEFANAVMVSLDDDIPNTFQKAALSANIVIEAFDDVEVIDDCEAENDYADQTEEAISTDSEDIEVSETAAVDSVEEQTEKSENVESDDENTADQVGKIVADADPENENVATEDENENLTAYSIEELDFDDVISESEIEKEQIEESSNEPQSPVFSDEQAAEIRDMLSTWLKKIYSLLNNTKKNDTLIYNLNNELMKFKNDYYSQLTSSIVSDLILLREDCRSSLRDSEKGSFKYNNYVNYLDCTIDQIKDKLDIYGVLVSDGKYTYNGEVIYPLSDISKLDLNRVDLTAPNVVYQPIANNCAVSDITDLASLGMLLDSSSSTLECALNERDNLVDSIEFQRMVLKNQLDVINGFVIIPVLRKIIRLEAFFEEKRVELDNFRDQADDIYREAYEHGADRIENMLFSLGVTVRSNVDDVYDPKHHKMIKTEKLSPEEQEKNMHVAAFVTDCYMRNDRVIAPAKVILYKL